MKVLFITRKYPPHIGGMENYSAGFVKSLAGIVDVIALRKSQVHLIWWIPMVIIKAVIQARKYDVIHIGDAVLAWPGVMISWLSRKPITITIHGLDITYKKYGYQVLVWFALKHYRHIVCVSNGTADLLYKRGWSKDTVSVITNAIDPQNWKIPRDRTILNEYIQESQGEIQVVLTVGRLVKRKGVAWFISEVMPTLPNSVHYIVVGSGPEHNTITKAIETQNLQHRVHVLGRVEDDVLRKLYGAVDVFIMPNIQVQNDIEGFGIVVIEASASGLPVIASNLEGIRDAVIDGSTGFLVESNNVIAWQQAIHNILQDPFKRQSVRSATIEQFSWATARKMYLTIFNNLKA